MTTVDKTLLAVLFLAAVVPLPPPLPKATPIAKPKALAVPSTINSPPINLTLAWDPPADSNIIGNRVFLGLAPGAYTVTNTYVPFLTNFALTGLATNQPYYFSVTWFYCNGLDSPFAAEVGFLAGGSLNLLLHSNTVDVSFMAWSNQYTLQTSADLTNWVTLTNLAGASNLVTVTAPLATNGFAFFELLTDATNAAALPASIPKLVTNSVPKPKP